MYTTMKIKGKYQLIDVERGEYTFIPKLDICLAPLAERNGKIVVVVISSPKPSPTFAYFSHFVFSEPGSNVN